jgi:hypothetical protein
LAFNWELGQRHSAANGAHGFNLVRQNDKNHLSLMVQCLNDFEFINKDWS